MKINKMIFWDKDSPAGGPHTAKIYGELNGVWNEIGEHQFYNPSDNILREYPMELLEGEYKKIKIEMSSPESWAAGVELWFGYEDNL